MIDIKGNQGCNIQGLKIANRGFSKNKFKEDFINMIDIMGIDKRNNQKKKKKRVTISNKRRSKTTSQQDNKIKSAKYF
jgi:hypothetical protein